MFVNIVPKIHLQRSVFGNFEGDGARNEDGRNVKFCVSTNGCSRNERPTLSPQPLKTTKRAKIPLRP